MMKSGMAAWVLLLSGAISADEGAAGKERQALVKDLTRAAAGIEARLKGKVVAMLDFRPEYIKEEEDSAPALAAAKLLQEQFTQALLAQAVHVVQAERGRPLKVKRSRNGALAEGMIFSSEDAQYFAKKKKAAFVLEGRISEGAGSIFAKNASTGYTLKLRLIDLKTGGVVAAMRAAKVNPKEATLEEICTGDLLPKYNRIVLTFAFNNIGQSIDSGECWDVPAHPLKKTGLRIRSYNFGTPVKWTEALPGDVVTSDTHVMVIVKPTPKGKGTTILHQNVGGKRYIIPGKLGDVSKLTVWRPGRPNPKFGNGKNLK